MKPGVIIGALAAVAAALGANAAGAGAALSPLRRFARADVLDGAGNVLGTIAAADLAARDLSLALFVRVAYFSLGEQGELLELRQITKSADPNAPAYVGTSATGQRIPFDPSNVKTISKD